jgi:hypothetical protein
VAERQVVSMRLVDQDLALPKTLRGLVASRVARLSSEDRATLQAAAVLGDPIDATTLSCMLGQAMPGLERSLAALKDRDLVVHTGPSELRFTSPLVPEIVVDALTPEAAREMHAAAGQALETTLRDRAWEHAGRIARHLYEAGDRERAATYFGKSGERRLETRQLDAAARDYARAIALSDLTLRGPDELAGWMAGLASAVRMVRSAPDAPELCLRAVARVDDGGPRDVRVRVRVAAGRILSATQHIAEGQRRLAEAEEIAEQDETLLKPVLLAGAELATRQGDFKRAWALLERLHGIVRAMANDTERHRVALHLALANAGLGDRAGALANVAEAEQLLPEDRTAQLERTKARALVDYFTRDFRSAALHCERGIDLGREMGLPYEVMLNLHNLGDVLVHLDDLPRAYGAITQSLALCEQAGFERLANYNRMFLAFLDGLQGSDAEPLLRQGIAYAESKAYTWDVIGGRVLLARLLHGRGQIEAARREYATTRGLATAAGHRFVAEDCELALQKLSPTTGTHTLPSRGGRTGSEP